LIQVNDAPAVAGNFAEHQAAIMNGQFNALPIDQRHAIAAYPLVSLHDARITTDQWLQFVRQRCDNTELGGLIAIRDCRGVIHALFSYRIESDLRVRRRLCIGELFVAHLPGSGIDAAIASSASELSAKHGCQAITIERPFLPAQSRVGCPTLQFLRVRRAN
jgi:hypothetical protein